MNFLIDAQLPRRPGTTRRSSTSPHTANTRWTSSLGSAKAFAWQDLAAGCDKIQLGDLVVQVASPRMLYRMKKDTVRLQDRADAERIREAFDLGDE